MAREFTIENEYLKVTVTTWGAQVKSVIRKCDNVEHMWNANKDVWGFHAPILFPHAGKVVDGKIEAKGGVYESTQHGFARGMEHEFVDQTADTIVLELKSVSQLEKVHFKQLQTYLRLANKPFGYLINFNTDKFTIGNSIHRVTNHDYKEE